MAISIFLVDDHPLFRKGLRILLEEQADFRIVGEAGDGREAIGRVRKLSPDVVIMDITMPDLDGIDATRQILSKVPSTKVVALSMHSEKDFVEKMLRAGASGYILKESVPEDIVSGIRTVMQGGVYLSPAITGIVVSEYKDFLAGSPSPAQIKDVLPILRSKLKQPALAKDLMPRSDLIARLDELRRRPLTLVSSAAGYGKTTMAGLWLEAWDGPCAWLSLDREDNDLRRFMKYLLTVLENMIPGACEATRSLLNAPTLSPVSVLSTHLLNDLIEIENPFILVLDDFHVIREKAVHDLMAALLKHPPESMHLILLARRDPPLLTGTLRGRDQVNEIGATDLQFTMTETKAFLKKTTGLEVDEKTTAIIQERIEGWPAGMVLLAQTLKRSGDLNALIAGLKGSFGTIVDYLVTEVLSHQPAEMARAMAATSIVDQFCAPLFDALIGLEAAPGAGEMNGDEFIVRLQKDKLFLISLDLENRWFRYHHVFQQLLQQQMNRYWSSEEIAALHSRAKAWLAENTMNDNAAKDPPVAFRDYEHRTMPDATDDKSPSPRRPDSQSLVDPLTYRELDVLDLLAQRLSNKEIAVKLFVSEGTVKWHLQNIYQKLNVVKRRDAVVKARDLGILSQG